MAAGRAVSEWPARKDSKATLRSQICTTTSRTIRAIPPSMATRPFFCFEKSLSGISTHLHADGGEFLLLALQNDARQRPRRRSLQHGTILRREIAVMAGASEPVGFPVVIDGAGKMRAFLAEGVAAVWTWPLWRRAESAAGQKPAPHQEWHSPVP